MSDFGERVESALYCPKFYLELKKKKSVLILLIGLFNLRAGAGVGAVDLTKQGECFRQTTIY